MARQVLWTKPVLDEFISLASLSREEEQIIRTRVQGWSRVQQSIEFGMSISTVDRIIHRLKRKYDSVQKFSNILPERKYSAEELFR